jgi:hypothetical protein
LLAFPAVDTQSSTELDAIVISTSGYDADGWMTWLEWRCFAGGVGSKFEPAVFGQLQLGTSSIYQSV